MTSTPQHVRERLLDEAVAALVALRDYGPGSDLSAASEASRRASAAVTAAVTRGDHIHTLIAAKARCTGLTVIRYIDDPAAHSRALNVERNAAANYVRHIEQAVRHSAVSRWCTEEPKRGLATRIARDLGISRATFYSYLEGSEVSLEDLRLAFIAEFQRRTLRLGQAPAAVDWWKLSLRLPEELTAASAAEWANGGFLPGEAEPLIREGRKVAEILAEEEEKAHAA